MSARENMWKNRFFLKYAGWQIAKSKKKKERFVHSEAGSKGKNFRKCISPYVKVLLHMKSRICGLIYEVIGDASNLEPNETVVYAGTHIGKYDWEMLKEALELYSYTIAGDWELMYGEFADYFFRLTGVIYVDTEDKADRRNTLSMMIKALKNDVPIFLFPEGIWNVSESLPLYQIYPGALKAAKAGSVPIVPIAIDQRKKHFTINVGEKFYVESEDWKAECEKLRDVLATLKWKIWEHYPREKRTDIPENYYHNFLTERLAEWPQFNMEIIKNRIHR